MSRLVAAGWYGDPGRTHEVRYWDGRSWTASVADRGTVSAEEVPGRGLGPPRSGDRLALIALGVLVVGGFVALVSTAAWEVWVGTSATLDAEDRVRGWTAVIRTLPAALVAWSVPIVAMVLAVHACRRGSASARVVIWLSGLVLFAVSASILGGTVESALTGSHPELKWALLPLSIAIAAGATALALRAAKRTAPPSHS